MDDLKPKASSNQIIDLLLYPPYLSFALSVFFSQVGFNMLNVVLIFLVFFLTSSNFSVSILLLTVLLPQIFLSFIGGVVADLASKKVILIVGNLLRAIAIVILFLNFSNIWVVYAMAFIVSTITQFYVPAESPMIPSLVNKERLVAANSIFGISLFGSILIGYVLAGPAVTAIGRGPVFILLAGVFLFAAIFAYLIPNKSVKKTFNPNSANMRRSIAQELQESYSLLRTTKSVGDAFFLLIFSQMIIFILATLIPGYAQSILEVPAEDLSIILFAPAALGMVISAVLIGSVFLNSNKEKLMNAGVFISGIVLALLPFTSRILSQGIIQTLNIMTPKFLELNVFNFVLILAFFAGFANALIFVPSQATIQSVIPANYRSKIYGLLFALIGVFSLLPIMIAGGVADIVGVGAVLFTIGFVIILIGLVREKFVIKLFWFLIRKK